MLSGLPSPALANHMWLVYRWLNSPCSPHMIRSFFLSPARDLSAPRSRTYLVFFLSSALRHRERHLSGGLDCEGASVLQRGLTARPGICAIVYTQSILPCSTRLWHKGLRMVVGQKEGSSVWALVLVSNSGKRRYILIPSLLLGERPLPPTQ